MKRTRHSAEQIIIKLREADAMLSGGKTMLALAPGEGVELDLTATMAGTTGRASQTKAGCVEPHH